MISTFIYLLSNVQGRVSMDHEATCTYMLCYAAYAWLSSRFDYLLSFFCWKDIFFKLRFSLLGYLVFIFLISCFFCVLCSGLYVFFLIASPEECGVWRSTKE